LLAGFSVTIRRNSHEEICPYHNRSVNHSFHDLFCLQRAGGLWAHTGYLVYRLGAGTTEPQVKVEREVVDEFNKNQDKIWLVLEVVPNSDASNTLENQIALGNGPDIVGPMDSYGANLFYGQWLDMAPYIEAANYDTSVFDEQLVKFYQTEEGQVSLPFAVYPSLVFYNKRMFDQAGLAYPPAKYDEQYRLPDGHQWNGVGIH
jgi:multiple sugar transport system substrate-binding protein